MSETIKRSPLLMEAAEYQHLLQQFDDSEEAQLRDAFVGLWHDREAFGQHLFADNDAERRLRTLPAWLRPFVRLDGTAFVESLEAEGLYTIADVSKGVCIFEGDLKLQQK